MKVISVNRSMPRALRLPGRDVLTGIDKQPAKGPVTVTADGLEGDGVGNPRDHGGPDQALYLYGQDEYHWWQAHKGLEVQPGLFGENLTLDELASGSIEVADRLSIGAVHLEVTAPRIPCATLSGRVGDGRFAETFAMVGRPGAYVRVLAEGTLEAGSAVEFTPSGSGVSLAHCVDAYYDNETPADELQRLLTAPVGARLRTMIERRLERAGRHR